MVMRFAWNTLFLQICQLHLINTTLFNNCMFFNLFNFIFKAYKNSWGPRSCTLKLANQPIHLETPCNLRGNKWGEKSTNKVGLETWNNITNHGFFHWHNWSKKTNLWHLLTYPVNHIRQVDFNMPKLAICQINITFSIDCLFTHGLF